MSTQTIDDISWVIRGNIVVPTGNPFVKEQHETDATAHDDDDDDSRHVLWLGPKLKILLDHVIVVNKSGIIVSLSPYSDGDEIATPVADDKFLHLSSEHEFLAPGFIDTHIHAPQFSYTGTATDRPLMGDNGWLETYTFPAEQRLGHDLEHAKHVYQSLVHTLLNNGTTTAVYFATLHVQPCKILVDTCIQHGQRAFVGKVCMDRNSPANYVQSCEQNIQQTRELVQYIHETCGRERNNTTLPLVLPIITPRFIPTCSTELMSALGDLVAEYQCHVQSHISESLDEVAFSRELDQEDNPLCAPRTDAAIFDAHDLLTDRCVMAHGVHLTRTDQKLLKDRGASVAHCPLSNFYFAGGSLPCRKMLENNNKVGLGTDVAGGYSPSMMNSMRMAVIASRSLEHADILTNVASTRPSSSDQHSIDYRHAFYLATLGGAEALGLQDRIGTFAVGMEFDAIVLSAVENSAQLFDTDRTADIFQKLCTLGDDRNIRHVFVQGRKVK